MLCSFTRDHRTKISQFLPFFENLRKNIPSFQVLNSVTHCGTSFSQEFFVLLYIVSSFLCSYSAPLQPVRWPNDEASLSSPQFSTFSLVFIVTRRSSRLSHFTFSLLSTNSLCQPQTSSLDRESSPNPNVTVWHLLCQSKGMGEISPVASIYTYFWSVINMRCRALSPAFARAFAKLRKATINFVISACTSVPLSVRTEQPGYYCTGFHKISYWSIFRKSVEKIQFSSISDKNNGYFTWRSTYICNHISLDPPYNVKCFRQNCRGNQNTNFMFETFFLKIVPFMTWCEKIWYSQTSHRWQ
jgi:hypothetical protein